MHIKMGRLPVVLHAAGIIVAVGLVGATRITIPASADDVAGAFTATGSMASARYYHTATVLPNGKVLVTGGYDGTSVLSSAELYDPATGTFTATGPMTAARQLHTATLLPNGKVLVTGGYDGTSLLSSAELYDPATGTFTATGSMITAHSSHTATLLPDGKVLVTGGSNGRSLSAAELYDPATGEFSRTGRMATARVEHTATLLPDGKVLVAGGFNNGDDQTDRGSGDFLSSAELYDPATGTFSPTGSMSTARYYHTAALLSNSKVLVAGGTNSSGNFLSSAELYDPATGTFSSTGSMTAARSNYTATLLHSNGKVLNAGGTGIVSDVNNSGLLSSAELYDPATGEFSATGGMTVERFRHTATPLPGGKVLVVGGSNGLSPSPFSSAELYDPAGIPSATPTPTSTPVPPPPASVCSASDPGVAPRNSHGATLLADGRVLIAGGGRYSPVSSAELYDAANGTFFPTGSMAVLRSGHTSTLLPDGTVLVAGGMTRFPPSSRASGGVGPVSTAELYNPVAGTFAATGSMTAARVGHSATLLPDGKVLIAGGTSDGHELFPLSSAELYDPATGTFSATGSMTASRQYHTATVLCDGRVLVTGGMSQVRIRSNESSRILLSSAELYDPARGRFTSTGSMAIRRQYHTATLLPSGTVLVAGGSSLSVIERFSSVELYDPATGTFSATGSMVDARSSHTATLLPAGKVLIAGGANLSSAELYDPAAGTFAATASMAVARAGHTATLLFDGKVLIVSGSSSFAELYDPAAGAFIAIGSATVARSGHTATLLLNGKVLIAGGSSRGLSVLAPAELYDPTSGTFSGTGFMITGRSGHSATLLSNGKVLIAGGYDGSRSLSSSELYDPATGSFSTTGSMAVARRDHTATLLPNGKVLVAGGSDGGSEFERFSSAELYDPATGTFSATGSMAVAHWAHTATLLSDGRVLIAGGFDRTSGNSPHIPTAELYDPATGAFSVTGPMGSGMWSHTATLLPNGKVLVVGEFGGGSEDEARRRMVSGRPLLSSAELYDPVIGAFTPAGSMATTRSSNTATLLPDGKVLIVGGYDGRRSLSSSELYDPVTRSFSVTGSMAVARSGHTATLLSNGDVLVAGGSVSGISAELYNPSTGTFSITGSEAATPEFKPGPASTFPPAPSPTPVLASGPAPAPAFSQTPTPKVALSPRLLFGGLFFAGLSLILGLAIWRRRR